MNRFKHFVLTLLIALTSLCAAAENIERNKELVLKLLEINSDKVQGKDLSFLKDQVALPMFLVVNEKTKIDCNYSEVSKTKWKENFLKGYSNKTNQPKEDIEGLDITTLDYVSMLKLKAIDDDGEIDCNIIIFKKNENEEYSPIFNAYFSKEGDEDAPETERAFKSFSKIGSSFLRLMNQSVVSTPIIFYNHYKYFDINNSNASKNVKDTGFFPDYKFLANKVDSILFDENEKGEIIFSGVVETQLNKDEILNEVAGCLKEFTQKNIIDISNEAQRQSSYSCTVKMGVGQVEKSWTVFGRTVASTIDIKSEIVFNLKVDAKDNRYRYTLSDFYTDRERISGSAKEHGQSNEIHFHRLVHMKGDRYPIEQIEDEKIQYRAERAAVYEFIEILKENIGKEEDF